MAKTKFVESILLGNQKIDREANIIHDVKVLGSISANGRIYTAEAMHNSLSLYAGAKVFIDHVPDPRANRSYRDSFGNLINPVVKKESDGSSSIFADLRYNPGHVCAEQLLHDAESNSGNVGLSHAVLGKHSLKDGKQYVEKIDHVYSVDIVSNPATTAGLFESLEKEEMEITDIESLKAAVAAVLETPDLDLAGMAKALCDLVHPLIPAEEPVDEKPADEADEKKADDEKKATDAKDEEIKVLKAELDGYKVREAIQEKKNKIDTQLKEAKLAPELVTPVFMTTLMEAQEDNVSKLIEDRKAIAGFGQKPQSKESHSNVLSESVKSTEDFVARLKK